jgi:hypothetical protein
MPHPNRVARAHDSAGGVARLTGAEIMKLRVSLIAMYQGTSGCRGHTFSRIALAQPTNTMKAKNNHHIGI